MTDEQALQRAFTKAMDVKTKLQRISDDLLDICDELPEDEARTLRQAAYSVEEIKTSKAVLELMQVGHRFHGGSGQTDAIILRPRRAA